MQNKKNLFADIKNSRVLITGHTGFKGTWLSHLLHNLGAEVFGLSLPLEQDPFVFFENSGASKIFSSQGSKQFGDIRNPELCKKIIDELQPHIILHLAAQSLVRRSYQDVLWTFESNIMGTANILEAARSCKSVRQTLIVTSDKCYDNREWVWGYREADALGGHDPYSASKACAEIVTQSYRKSFGHPDFLIASARAGNVFGGGDWAKDRILPDYMRAIQSNSTLSIRNPNAQRPWQYVLEALGAYLLILDRMFEHGDEFAQAWNFGPQDQDAVTVKTLIDSLQKFRETSKQNLAQIKFESESNATSSSNKLHEAKFLKLDTSKARLALGWSPILELSKGLEWTNEWYENHFKHNTNSEDFTKTQAQKYLQLMFERYE